MKLDAGTGEAAQARHEMDAPILVSRWRELWPRLRTLKSLPTSNETAKRLARLGALSRSTRDVI